MNKPLISIITVVYNAEGSIEKTLDSLSKQSFKNFEFIIIDGKSSDKTLEIIKKYSFLVSKLISEPDEGLYFAMNKGKNLATGDYSIFINAGDFFCDDAVLENVANNLIKKNIIYYGNAIVYFNNLKSKAPNLHHQTVFFPSSFYLENDYNAVKFKVTAEGDYIYRALKSLKSEHIDVDIVYSELVGFRVTRFKTLKGLIFMYKESMEVLKGLNGKVNLKQRMNYLGKSFIKYAAFKIGGIKLVARVLINSYKN